MNGPQEALRATERNTLRLYLSVVRAMRKRGVARVDVRVVEPHPYPEVAGYWDAFDGAVLASGEVLRDGVPVQGLTARARALRSMVELGRDKRVTHQAAQAAAA